MIVFRLSMLLGVLGVVLGVGCASPLPAVEDGGVESSGGSGESSEGSADSSGSTADSSGSTGSEADTVADDTAATPVCGNGLVEAGEECDGDDHHET